MNADVAVRESKRRLKVLHVINGLARGGAETVLYRLITNTPGIEHEVVCLVEPGWYSDKLEAHGIRVHHLNWTSWPSAVAAMRRLQLLIRKSDADLVQAWMYRSNVLAGLFSRMVGKPVLWNVRCSSLGPLRLASRIAARVGGLLAGSHADMVVNCSAASADLHAGFGYGRAEGMVIPNGYDPAEIQRDDDARDETRKSLGAGRDQFVMGCIARWHRQKGFPIVFQALRLLEQRGVPCRFLLVGNGLDESNSELMGLIERYGCSKMVDPMGETSDVPAIARALDLHVLASIGSEGFPNTVAETMLAATPNVATYVGDAALIIGDTGWVVEPNDPGKLADAIEKAYREWKLDPDRWQQRRAQARKRITDEFPLSRMAESYESLWARVAGARHRGKAQFPVSPRRLRVLHIISGLGPGGAETLLYRLVASPLDVDHEVICLGRRDWYSPMLEKLGVTVHHIPVASFGAAAQNFFRIKRLAREFRADVVQCWMYRANVVGGIASRAAGIPVVWGIHCSSLEPLRPASRLIARISGKLARWVPDAVINCSARSAEIHEGLGYSAADVAVIQNGYDPDVFRPDDKRRAATRKALGVDREAVVLGSIGRWHPQKGLPVLIEALALLRARGVSAKLLLVGRGLREANADLVQLVADGGCADMVELIGERSDIPDVARALDIHVLASVGSEAFPNVVAETMLSGTPNVVTDVGDMALMVGDTGWVVPPNDPERLADAIEAACSELAGSPERWKQRRDASRKRIADNFAFERMAERYEEVWMRVSRR